MTVASIGPITSQTVRELGLSVDIEATRYDIPGLVEAIRDDGGVVTIEGNTDERGGSTGGKVMRHVRRANMVGFGQPKSAAGRRTLAVPIELMEMLTEHIAARGLTSGDDLLFTVGHGLPR